MARQVNASYEASDNRRKPIVSMWQQSDSVELNNIYLQGTVTVHYNSNIKLAIVSFNLNVRYIPPVSTPLVYYLPTPSVAHYVAFSHGSNATMRGYINTDGDFAVDVEPTTTGWYAGSTAYPYESL